MALAGSVSLGVLAKFPWGSVSRALAADFDRLEKLVEAFAIPACAWQRILGEEPKNVGRPTEPISINDAAWQGAPLGGFGAGTIGRAYRGDFARWHLVIGQHRYSPVWADQFSCFQYGKQSQKRIGKVLFPGSPGNLKSWEWGYPKDGGRYYALYPRAWYLYTNDE